MNQYSDQRHVIDFLFPIALLFVFAASSLSVVLFAADAYQKTAASSEHNHELRTALDYVTEKIRQGDTAGAVSVGTFDGHKSLIIRQSYGEQEYVTYIYEHDGYLKELFIRNDAQANASAGAEIAQIHSFDVSCEDRMYRLSCEMSDGKTSSALVTVRSSSEKGGAP